jgi:TctA family transporter
MFAEAISAMLSVLSAPYLMVLILGTTVLGVIFGALPGLGATTGPHYFCLSR